MMERDDIYFSAFFSSHLLPSLQSPLPSCSCSESVSYRALN
jgi:hypothetical protein